MCADDFEFENQNAKHETRIEYEERFIFYKSIAIEL